MPCKRFWLTIRTVAVVVAADVPSGLVLQLDTVIAEIAINAAARRTARTVLRAAAFARERETRSARAGVVEQLPAGHRVNTMTIGRARRFHRRKRLILGPEFLEKMLTF